VSEERTLIELMQGSPCSTRPFDQPFVSHFVHGTCEINASGTMCAFSRSSTTVPMQGVIIRHSHRLQRFVCLSIVLPTTCVHNPTTSKLLIHTLTLLMNTKHLHTHSHTLAHTHTHSHTLAHKAPERVDTANDRGQHRCSRHTSSRHGVHPRRLLEARQHFKVHLPLLLREANC